MIALDSLEKTEIDTNLLFHYTRVQPAIEHILSDGELLFNSPKHMSDPLEFENYLYMFYAHPDMSYFTFSDLQNDSDQINLVLKRIFKLCCFSVDVPGPSPNYQQLLHHRGFCRSRMWSQYGDSHRGLCLVFDGNRLLHHLNFSIESIEVPVGSKVRLYSGMVAYDNRLTGLHDALLIKRDALKDGPVIDLLSKNIDKYLFMKVEDYRDESEFRICIYSDSFKEDDSLSIKYLDSLEAIILGCRFPEPYMPSMKVLSSKMRIPIYQMSWYNGKPSVYSPK